jgi:FliI/YscN family ATPase
LSTALAAQIESARTAMPLRIRGTVQGLAGLTVEASDLPLPVGSLCRIHSFGNATALAEVIGFRQERTLLMAMSPMAGVARGDRVENIASAPRIWVSDELLGRVVNGLGRPIDGKGPLRLSSPRRIDGRALAPLERSHIDQPISTSIRAIDGLLTCGLGQRMGIFSGPGVGKSTLLSSIARHTNADVTVVALIGERGREVKDFLHRTLDESGRSRCVAVISTSDDPAILRVRAAKVATTIAEYFRDQGKNVLLLLDSITRLCQAQRQIGLSAMEPPTTKGYPPSMFAILPELLERAGRGATGSITGFYTVLVEGDDFNEVIPDTVKGITDGHIWLDRKLASIGHFPAIDILQSISRVRGEVVSPEQERAARRVAAILATYRSIEDLVNIGAYVRGVNHDYDLAVQTHPQIIQYLRQDAGTPSGIEASRRQLFELAGWIDQRDKEISSQAGKPAQRGGSAS